MAEPRMYKGFDLETTKKKYLIDGWEEEGKRRAQLFSENIRLQKENARLINENRNLRDAPYKKMRRWMDDREA